MKYKFLFPIFLTFAVAAFGQSLPEFKVNALKLDGRNKARESKMKQALKLLEKAVNDGEAMPVHLTFLTDQVRLAQGKPQLYGTQTRVTKERKFEVPPIEDEANADKRRASVGLEPLADYIQKMRQMYDKSSNQ